MRSIYAFNLTSDSDFWPLYFIDKLAAINQLFTTEWVGSIFPVVKSHLWEWLKLTVTHLRWIACCALKKPIASSIVSAGSVVFPREENVCFRFQLPYHCIVRMETVNGTILTFLSVFLHNKKAIGIQLIWEQATKPLMKGVIFQVMLLTIIFFQVLAILLTMNYRQIAI